MKRRNAKRLLLAAALTAVLAGGTVSAGAGANSYRTPVRVESTAYFEGEITSSGQPVRTGIAAGRKEWEGLTCIMYADENGQTGELIGIYEIMDTGKDQRIKDGKCIDVYIPDEDACWEWGRKKVWIQLVDAKG